MSSLYTVVLRQVSGDVATGQTALRLVTADELSMSFSLSAAPFKVVLTQVVRDMIVGPVPLGLPPSGAYAPGQIALSPTETIAQAFDAMNVALRAIAQAGDQGIGDVVGEVLAGVQDGQHTTFMPQNKFVLATLKVFFNGMRLAMGPTADFVALESQGAGTGFDTLTVVPGLAPRASDVLMVDYAKAPTT